MESDWFCWISRKSLILPNERPIPENIPSKNHLERASRLTPFANPHYCISAASRSARPLPSRLHRPCRGSQPLHSPLSQEPHERH